MFIKQYRHRLPTDYDMSKIRDRAIQGRPHLDDWPGLAFKAFSIEDEGKQGAVNNAYDAKHCKRGIGDAGHIRNTLIFVAHIDRLIKEGRART